MTKNCLNCYYRMGKTEDNKSVICEIDRKIKAVTSCDEWKKEMSLIRKSDFEVKVQEDVNNNMIEEKVKCPYCGETENFIKINETRTFDEKIIDYKCLKCNKTFHY